jgi:hypothetical protein
MSQMNEGDEIGGRHVGRSSDRSCQQTLSCQFCSLRSVDLVCVLLRGEYHHLESSVCLRFCGTQRLEFVRSQPFVGIIVLDFELFLDFILEVLEE